jgi:hypothetical protein
MIGCCFVYCCICNAEMDWHKRYGREGCCCGQDCHQEFEWRRTLSILNKTYYPNPNRIEI